MLRFNNGFTVPTTFYFTAKNGVAKIFEGIHPDNSFENDPAELKETPLENFTKLLAEHYSNTHSMYARIG